MVERIAQILTELIGNPVSKGDVIGMLVILGICVTMGIMGSIAVKNSRIDYEAVEADRKRYEKEINGWD